MSLVQAQTDPPATIETFPKSSSEELTESGEAFALPNPLPAVPVVAVPDTGKYVLELNRSPLVGNRLRLESIYDEARLRFTRPRNWKPQTVKMSLRYRHSPALYASRSNLTVLINGTSIGSVPLNQPEAKIGTAVFDVSPDLIQDYNEVTIAALQNNSPTCTQDPYDPSLWTEVMPDSKLVFDFQPQPIAMDFNRYPYPIFDTLSLEANQIAYLQPQTLDETWLTAAARLQAALGRVAVYRDMETHLISTVDEVKLNQRLIVIGTPEDQPALKSLKLPLALKNQQILDGKQQPFPQDVGLLMLTTASENRTPVLIATGNGAAGVAKAVQFLVQTPDRQMGTGNVIVVSEVASVPSPPIREWSGYLPTQNRFKLSDLRTYEQKPYTDVSVRGSHAPALEVDFRALPDDLFVPGSTMTLNYSYGAQVNPLTSLVEVLIDGVPLAGNRLASPDGATRQSMKIEIAPDRIKPSSKMQINFRLDPRERRSCSRVTDQQLWGTIHADTSFDLKREHAARLPDLKLMQSAFPFAAPQDLSSTAIVMPQKPSSEEVVLLLEMSARLGRLSQSDTVQLEVFRADNLPPEKRATDHLIGIGTQATFPLPEAFEADGFALKSLLSRQQGQSALQTLPDSEGVLKEIVSPWNSDRVLLALTGQTEVGLKQVGQLMHQDPLFYQLEGDTVLISANQTEPSPYSTQDYNLEFLRQSPQREVSSTSQLERLLSMLRNNWFVLAPGLIAAALMLYGVAQLYLKKFTGQEQRNG
ncbi:MAG: cellulose biosynthesis cyclic di-GMP-binding regulatory protein BcsB [Oscillatoriophycideae cyanobacterium NC_groundwater_1537_Pr4_S-0.65um_50_18]|nr:cellulose biosynthesis cyclic di-GMP-binding regulatory protein BcsB [Oscillatoriophycideae cyanobacterium NC_groundwater_1537_Pr4_S-0.65um_50_18]